MNNITKHRKIQLGHKTRRIYRGGEYDRTTSIIEYKKQLINNIIYSSDINFNSTNSKNLQHTIIKHEGGARSMKNIRGVLNDDILKINKDFENILKLIFVFQTNNTFDTNWYIKSNQYVLGLEPSKKYMLYTYTLKGDKIINKHIRNNKMFIGNNAKNMINEHIFGGKTIVTAVQIFKRFNIDPNKYITKQNSLSDEGRQYIKTNIFIKFIQKVSRIFLILFFYMDLEVLR
jgi:hypothetical protein